MGDKTDQKQVRLTDNQDQVQIYRSMSGNVSYVQCSNELHLLSNILFKHLRNTPVGSPYTFPRRK